MPKNNHAVIYCRVSTEIQAKELSLDLQKKVCKDFATAKDLVVSKTYYEVGSAYHGNQPQLKLLMNKLKAGMTIVVYAMDRFTRNLDLGKYLLDKIAKKKCQLISVTGESNQLEAIRIAQCEAEALGRRIRDRVTYLRNLGSHIGPAPYGYNIRNVKQKRTKVTLRKLLTNDVEMEVVQLILLMRNEDALANDIISQVQIIKGPEFNVEDMVIGEGGVCHFTTISQFLNDLEIKYRGDTQWTPAKVSKVYRNNSADQ